MLFYLVKEIKNLLNLLEIGEKIDLKMILNLIKNQFYLSTSKTINSTQLKNYNFNNNMV